MERSRLDQITVSLQNKQVELEALCRQPEAVKKIEEIATGILRKNYKFVRELEEIEKRDKQVVQRIEKSSGIANRRRNFNGAGSSATGRSLQR